MYELFKMSKIKPLACYWLSKLSHVSSASLGMLVVDAIQPFNSNMHYGYRKMTKLKMEEKCGRYPHRIIQPSVKHTKLKGMISAVYSSGSEHFQKPDGKREAPIRHQQNNLEKKLKGKKRFSSPLPLNSPWQMKIHKNEGNYWWKIWIGRLIFHSSALVTTQESLQALSWTYSSSSDGCFSHRHTFQDIETQGVHSPPSPFLCTSVTVTPASSIMYICRPRIWSNKGRSLRSLLFNRGML